MSRVALLTAKSGNAIVAQTDAGCVVTLYSRSSGRDATVDFTRSEARHLATEILRLTEEKCNQYQ